MINRFTKGLSLNIMEKNIVAEISDLEFWGDLEVSFEEFEALMERVKDILSVDGVNIEYICKKYPHAITTSLVFYARYKYNTNFWGSFSKELGITMPQHYQAYLGACARKMFEQYGFDYSETKEESRINIAPIIYEACLPPESCLDDLFYVLSYDSYGMFDPQIVIEELIEMRSYTIRKPLLRFLRRFKDERALDFLIDIRDAIVSAEQNTMQVSRYSNNYSEWKQNEKSKTTIENRKKQEFQIKPYLYFDNGKKGLCIILPRVVMENEWVDEVAWTIVGKSGFNKSINAMVLGDEGTRFIDSMLVPVVPDTKYTITLTDMEDLDESSARTWDLEGVAEDKVLMFNHNGRQINSTYLPAPFSIAIIPNTVSIEATNNVEFRDQFYPTNSNDYRVVAINILGSDAYVSYKNRTSIEKIIAKSQINIQLSGEKLFSLEESFSQINLFVEEPKVLLEFDSNISVDGLEIRVDGISKMISKEKCRDNTYSCSLVDFLGVEKLNYGLHSVRLYQFGRFLKQVEFSLVPHIKTTYSSAFSWSENDQRKKKKYKFEKLSGWEYEFSNCLVTEDENEYSIECSPNCGSIVMQLKMIDENVRFSCSTELPITPYEIELLDSDGNNVGIIADKNLKISSKDMEEKHYWLSLKVYGKFIDHYFQLELTSVNGLEQVEGVRLNISGVANIDLGVFNDTFKNCPMPVRIILRDQDDDKIGQILFINETTALESRPKYKRGDVKDYIVLDIKDDEKDLDIIRFGNPIIKHHLLYENSVLGKSGKTRGYIYPDRLTQGIYIIHGNKKDTLFEYEDDNIIDLNLDNNIMLVSCRSSEHKDIITVKQWLDLFISDVIMTDNNSDFSMCRSVKMFKSDDFMGRLEKAAFDKCDIEKSVAIAYFAVSKISNEKKKLIIDVMNYISMHCLGRGDRYEIISLLVALKCSMEVFNICLKEYSLLLFDVSAEDVKQIAREVEEYSTELEYLLLVGCDLQIKDCVLRDKFRDLIGKDAIKKLLSVPGEEDAANIAFEQKKFLREQSGCRVRIQLDDEISGNEEAIQGMIGYDKRYNPIFDISKKPDYGVYFARIKYVDQFVNWYKNTHDKKQEMYPEFKQMKDSIVKKYYTEIISAISKLEKDEEMGEITKQYKKALNQRCTGHIAEAQPNNVSYPLYFMAQGLAAYLAKIPADRADLDDFRHLGIEFMSYASKLSPRMSQRDILMAATYIYLKRKEAKLCR